MGLSDESDHQTDLSYERRKDRQEDDTGHTSYVEVVRSAWSDFEDEVETYLDQDRLDPHEIPRTGKNHVDATPEQNKLIGQRSTPASMTSTSYGRRHGTTDT